MATTITYQYSKSDIGEEAPATSVKARCTTASGHLQCRVQYVGPLPEFKTVTQQDMSLIWQYLCQEQGRTTDFSYGGVLMWVDYFNYEYAIVSDTLFIKGCLEDDRTTPAFSLPIGQMPIALAIDMLRQYCSREGIRLEFSAIPEYAVPAFCSLNPRRLTPLTDWADYLYDAESLATLTGKKNGKKRNHVNRFMQEYPDWSTEPLGSANADEVMAFMDIYDLEGDDNDSARAERMLTRRYIQYAATDDSHIEGMVLRANGQICAFTIGDIKGDTLFVHIEKATRHVNGSYEMINKAFAESMVQTHPQLRYINREDAAGDEGLKRAKESYHPVDLLQKYNIEF